MSEKQKKALEALGKVVAKPSDAKKEGKEGGTSMNTETTKITAVEVMTTGAEIVKMSANEQPNRRSQLNTIWRKEVRRMKVEKNSAVRPRGTDSAKLMVVIVTESLKGCGTEDDPVSVVKQYWSIDGELLATGER